MAKAFLEMVFLSFLTLLRGKTKMASQKAGAFCVSNQAKIKAVFLI